MLKRYWFEEMYLYDEPVAYFKKPIIYRPGSQIKIKAIAKAANSDEKLILLGFIVERVGKNVGRP